MRHVENYSLKDSIIIIKIIIHNDKVTTAFGLPIGFDWVCAGDDATTAASNSSAQPYEWELWTSHTDRHRN
jgi:hypothetical protein